jgi:uncharacterized membrane protein
MRTHPGAACALVVLAVLLVPGGAAAVVGVSTQVGDPEVTRDSTLLWVDLRADGSAVWTVSHRTRLDGPNETAAFESLADEVRATPESYTARFARRMAVTAVAAEDATGRAMAIENVTVRAETTAIPAQYGVLSYRFEWVGFARVSGDRLVVDDVLAGLFLDEETRLLVTWPEGYEVVEARPPPTERRDDAVVWVGATEFGPGEPRVGIAPTPRVPLGSLAVGVVALVVAAAVALRYAGRSSGRTDRQSPRETADGGSESGTLDPGLLSNEERVVHALRAAGGRMRQQELVAELGWTEAKTSQVLGRLRETGTVESFRLGRENVLSLAEDEP